MSLPRLPFSGPHVEVDYATPVDWTSLWAALDGRPYPPFWRSEWRAFLIATTPGAVDRSLRFRFPSGRVALMPLVAVPRRFRKDRHFSSTDDEYGGLASADALDRAEVLAAFEFLGRYARPVRVTVGPGTLPAADAEPLPLPAPWTVDEATTHILQLPATYDEWFKDVAEHAIRKNVKRALSSGLSVERDKTSAQTDAFYDLYRLSSERWKIPAAQLRSRDYLAALIDNPLASLYVVWKDTKPLSALITLQTELYVFNYRGVSDAEFFQLRPADLAFSSLVTDSIAQRKHLINCGGSAGIKGVADFKEKAGAVLHRYATYVAQDAVTTLEQSVAANRRAITRRLQRLSAPPAAAKPDAGS